MMLTEDDAKQKACCKCMPHRPDGQLMTAACLASACMAWRWNVEQVMPRRIMHYHSQETKEPDRRPEEVPKGWVFRPCIHHATRYEPAYWFEPKEMHEERIKNQLPLRGYCGLAGSPK